MKRMRWPLIVAAVLGLLAWVGYAQVVDRARDALNQRLAERGLALTCASESWSLWGGIALKEATLRRTTAGQEPVIFISAVRIEPQWRAVWDQGAAVMRWQSKDATLILHDEEGPITLESFSTDLVTQPGRVSLARASTRSGGLAMDVAGEVMTVVDSTEAPRGEFQLHLKALRAVLGTLEFSAARSPYRVTGNFAVDLRQSAPSWSADLKGEGRDVAWRGVPMQAITSEGRLSEAGMKVENQIEFARGSAQVKLTREDGWQDTPLHIAGTLTDTAKRTSDFTGSLRASARTVKIDQLIGDADLLELAGNVPFLAAYLPRDVQVTKAPQLAISDFVYVWPAEAGEASRWSIASLQLRSPASVSLNLQTHPLSVDDITGSLSYAEGRWRFQGLKGQLLGGRFALAGEYDGDGLNKADLSLQSLQVARLYPWAGETKGQGALDNSRLTLSYQGTVSSRDPARSAGAGSMVLTDAPVVQVPLLEQAYALFPSVLPRGNSGGIGELRASFRMTNGIAKVHSCKASSKALTVTASGTVDLVKRRVDGQARANLRGLVGVVTTPLSSVLTDMDIHGPFDDIRVTPRGPVSAASKVKDAAKDGVKLGGKAVRTGLSLPFRALGVLDR